MCPCGSLQPFASAADLRTCDHPLTSWWTDRDTAILEGEVAKLADLPRPLYIQREHGRMVYGPINVPITNVRYPRRWPAELAALLMIVGIALGVIMLLSVGGERTAPPPCPGDPAGCADIATVPVTMVPPPAPTGR